MQSVVSRAKLGRLRPCLKLSSFSGFPRALPRSSLFPRAYATAQLDLPALDEKWRRSWSRVELLERGPSRVPDNGTADPDKNMYILAMFPYPSGALHLGHLRVYTVADVVARFRRLQGRNVLLPMGWDAFGLPAENAAIERGIDPAEWTRDNITKMKDQLQLMNASFDWTREFATCDPEYYKHNQKIFLLLRKNGLVSRKKATVNWDPVENTVLANEQVDAEGRSWRSGAIVEQRELEQWFLHITDFKEALLRDLKRLARDDAWPERVLAMQKNWLGRSEGAYYQFPVHSQGRRGEAEEFQIYTTRPETIFAAEFIAISPNSQLAEKYAENDPELREFLDRAKTLPHDSTEGYRVPHIKAINPLSFVRELRRGPLDTLPVYVAPYVRGDYETGAVMGVPGHDERDFRFWKRQNPNVPIKFALTRNRGGPTHNLQEPELEPGFMTALASEFSGQPSYQVAKDIVQRIKDGSQMAQSLVKWKLRDWLISRQRYWGTPIPIIHCHKCGSQPVPDDQLPVELPKVAHHWADGRAGNPLESATDWVNTTCPQCHGPAKRDTDTMDTFMDSSWYYMRFPDPHNPDLPVSEQAAKLHLPVDIYIGGVEHAILHLLYARFIYKAVMGLLYPTKTGGIEEGEVQNSTKEPFKRLVTQGMVHGKTYTDPVSGRFLKPDELNFSDASKSSAPMIKSSGKQPLVSFEKMSKSKHNGVDPGSFISQYGADATRAHILFQAPVGEVLEWDEDKITGITRWLSRVHEYVQTLPSPTGSASWNALQYFSKGRDAVADADVQLWRATQQAIINITRSMEDVYSLNTVVSSLMSLTKELTKNKDASDIIKIQATTQLLRMMAPVTPAVAEECWSILYPSRGSIFESQNATWPVADGTLELLNSTTITCAVQVNGKLRCVVEIPAKPAHIEEGAAFQGWVTEEILKSPDAQKRLTSDPYDIRQARRVIPVKNGKTVNYVLGK